jgi:hypothetical protein
MSLICKLKSAKFILFCGPLYLGWQQVKMRKTCWKKILFTGKIIVKCSPIQSNLENTRLSPSIVYFQLYL